MAMKEGKPPHGDYDAGAHAKQPRGKSIGIHDGPKGHVGTSFKQEAREQSRPMHETEHGNKPPANIPQNNEGSSLVHNDGVGHAKQPHGQSIGAGEHHHVHGSGYVRASHHHEHLSRHVGGKGHRIGRR